VAFSQTELLGVYSAAPVFPNPTAGPSGPLATRFATVRPTGSAAPPATLAPGATPTAVPSAPPVDPNAPIRFAVDLFDASESDIAPGSPSAIVALGRQPGASAAPGESGAPTPAPTTAPGASAVPGGATTDSRPVARDELWFVLVLIVLVVLTAEWLVYHRDAVTRLWRGLRRTPSAR
jgi:hypothetical protein